MTAPAPSLDVPATAPGQRRTLVVHVNDPEGFDVYVARRVTRAKDQRCRENSLWRNPWRVGASHPGDPDSDGFLGGGGRPMSLAEVLDIYERRTLPSIRARLAGAGLAGFFEAKLSELAGRRLGCWCADIGHPLSAADPLRCHGQILAKLADEAVGR